jgi:hypothetical protein
VTTQNIASVVLTPDSGTWTAPTVVLKDLEAAPPGDLANIQEFTGLSDNPQTPANEAALTLRLACIDVLTGQFRGADMLLLPAGNLDMPITATLEARIQVEGHPDDLLTDVDGFVGWEPPG